MLEGLAAIAIGCTSYFFIPDFPENAPRLKPKDKEFIIARARINTG